jgi:phosphoribosylformylglycinamidine synthase
VESSLRNGVGVMVTLADDPFVALFSESAGRVVVTVEHGDAQALQALAAKHGVTATPLGVTGGQAIDLDGQFTLPLAELREAWTATLPAALS